MQSKKRTLCCIFNYAPHYRLPIYKKIDDTIPAHFYFGNTVFNNEHIEKLDYSQLNGFQKELKVRCLKIGHLSIECTEGWIRLALNRKYKQYLITPNQFALNQWIFLLLCFVLGKKVYVWMHGLKNSRVSSKTLYVWKLYDFFITGSFLYGNLARDNMIRLGFNPNKLHIIYNSLDYDVSVKLRDMILDNPYRNHFLNDLPVLLFIGRLTVVKKLHMISKATEILKKRGINVNVVIIGDGPESINIQNSIAVEDKHKYWFVGSLFDETEIARYLYNADLCVSPGNVGLTGIHALSYGLPVITNDNFETQMPEFEAIEKGVSGDFFMENDVEDLAYKIELWLKNNTDRELVRNRCYGVIDSKYNPNYQVNLVKTILHL